MRYIYADNSATTAISPTVLEKMMPVLTEYYGNPSSLYRIGGKAKEILENSREVSRNYKDLYQKGLLYILRRSYFEDCEALLNPEHHITFEEFRSISEDHDLYN